MDIKALFHQIGSFFQIMTLKQRIVAAVSLMVVIGFLAFLTLFRGDKGGDFSGYSVLFENTSAEDSALIIQQLDLKKIPYKIQNEGTILVPSDVVYKERIAIAAMGIPKSSKVGFEVFDKSEFGATDFEQQVKYLRALEGELTRTIENLQPIARAGVHIAIPKESVFTERQTPPTASVVLEIRPMMRLTPNQITGIKNLVAASVVRLTPENVKLINQDGVPLGDDEGLFDNELVQSQVRYKKDFEGEYERKIVNVLSPILGGTDKVVAKVTIDFDFAKKDSISEVYDPESVPRSEQFLEENREGKRPAEVGGVPGAVSNIGPVEGIQSDNITEKYSKNTATTNYEVSKKVTNIKGQFATIDRVSAAVVVDGKYEQVDEDGVKSLRYVPLSDAEVESIRAIVRQTVGFHEARGDEVTVSNFEFKPLYGERLSASQEIANNIISILNPITPVLKYLLVFIILFIFYKKVIVPFSQKMLETNDEDLDALKAMEEVDEEESAEDTLEKFKKARKRVEDQLGLGDEFNEDELKYEVLLEKLKAMVNDKGAEVAVLLQGMVQSENDLAGNFKKSEV